MPNKQDQYTDVTWCGGGGQDNRESVQWNLSTDSDRHIAGRSQHRNNLACPHPGNSLGTHTGFRTTTPLPRHP